MPISRDDRQGGKSDGKGDRRSPFQIDRDRLLYSMPFRRLAGVTQVVSPGEGEIFHNRLTHSIKVAQIARRLAESLSREHPSIVDAWGGLDPDVAEAAALAHDLGHPPFGHVAERELDSLIAKELGGSTRTAPKSGRPEGYEGNAQSFRIVTELAVRRPEAIHGLDLTRATLNAILKYPWKWRENPERPTKYGLYECDHEAFQFARRGTRDIGANPQFTRSLEAQIMDWADDIAYSVHDTEDFYRAGLIPLDRLSGVIHVRDRFFERTSQKAQEAGINVDNAFRKIFNNMFNIIGVREPYTGTREQQEILYGFVSSHINRFVNATKLKERPERSGDALDIAPGIRIQVFLLKQLLWVYVIENPASAAQRLGQRTVIRTLFREFSQAIQEKNWSLFPPFHQERVRTVYGRDAVNGRLPATQRARLVSDTIASLSDRQAALLYQQFSGVGLGSVLAPVIS